MSDHDRNVIGAGSAAEHGAGAPAGAGLHVAIVEREPVGPVDSASRLSCEAVFS